MSGQEAAFLVTGGFRCLSDPRGEVGGALGALSGFAPVCSQSDSCAGGVASPRHRWRCDSQSQQKMPQCVPWHPARGESAPSKLPELRRAKVLRRFSLYTRRVCSSGSGSSGAGARRAREGTGWGGTALNWQRAARLQAASGLFGVAFGDVLLPVGVERGLRASPSLPHSQPDV